MRSKTRTKSIIIGVPLSIAIMVTSLAACTPIVSQVDPTSEPTHPPIPATPEPTKEIVIEDGILTRINNLMKLNLKDMKYYHEGKAGAQNQDRKWGFVDEEGHWVIDPIYDEVGDFSEGMAMVGVKGEPFNNRGYINDKGEVVVEPQYQYANEFSNGLAYVGDNYHGYYIDNSGEVVLNEEQYENYIFQDGYFREDGTTTIEGMVEEDGVRIDYTGVIDRSGKLLIDGYALNISCIGADHNGYRIATNNQERRGSWDTGVIDSEGNWVIRPIYDQIEFVDDDTLIVSHVEKGQMVSGIMSLDGEWVREPEGRCIQQHGEDMFVYYDMKEPQTMQLYDAEGNPLLKGEKYDSINIVAENLVVCREDESSQLYLSDGTRLMEEYEVREYGTRPIGDNLIMINTMEGNNKECKGVIDMSNPNEWFIEPKYDRIIMLENDLMLGTVTDFNSSMVKYHYEILDSSGNVLSISEEASSKSCVYSSIFHN